MCVWGRRGKKRGAGGDMALFASLLLLLLFKRVACRRDWMCETLQGDGG